MAVNDTVLARILIDDQTKLGFNSYARNVERAKKTSEAFRNHAIDKISLGLEKQVQVLKKTAKEFDLLQAANMGASQAQLEHITSLHDAIDAHHAAEKAAEEQRKAQDALAAAQKRSDDITEKAIQNLQFQAQAADLDADEIEILRLRLMGLSEEQLDLVRDTQLATKAKREQGKAASGAHGQLRLMRGGLGQLGHQVQDVAVQLQMGQNALLVLGQQGGQVASLFGQNGALFGAVLAVGAAVGTYLSPELFKTVDVLEELAKVGEDASKVFKDDLAKGVKDLSEDFAELRERDIAAFEAALGVKVVSAAKAAELGITELEDIIKELAQDFSVAGAAAMGASEGVDRIRERFNLSEEDARAFAGALKESQMGADDAVLSFMTFVDSLIDFDKEGLKGQENLVELSNKLREHKIALEDAATAQTAYQTVLIGGNQLTQEQLEAQKELVKEQQEQKDKLLDIVEALGLEKLALEQGTRAVYEYNLSKQGMSAEQIAVTMSLYDQIAAMREEADQAAKNDLLDKQKADRKQSFIDSINAQANALGKSSIELLKEQAAIHGVTTELDAAFETLEKFKKDQEAKTDLDRMTGNVEAIRQSLLTEEEVLLESHQKKLADLDEALNNEVILEERYNETKLRLIADFEKKKSDLQKKSGDQEILQGDKLTGHMLDQLGEQFSGVQAANKKMFAAQKAYKIAKATQNTFDAANEALASPYPWPLPQVFAATAVAAGLANVAAIKSSSFEGGGYTGMGARAGGMDGKGGFPAILHPNETVVDHSKGQSQGITIINNVDASGAGADVDMKIAAAMQQTSQQTIASVQDLMRRSRM